VPSWGKSKKGAAAPVLVDSRRSFQRGGKSKSLSFGVLFDYFFSTRGKSNPPEAATGILNAIKYI
jgi:hypothetical protein